MHSIYTAASEAAAEHGQPINPVMGANIAGFVKVAAMIDQGRGLILRALDRGYN